MCTKQQRTSTSYDDYVSSDTASCLQLGEGPLLDQDLDQGPWSPELLAYDESVEAGQTALDNATPWLDRIDAESASARHAYKSWDAEAVGEHGKAAADAAEAVNEGLSEAWTGADAAFEADGGEAFDDRRADLEDQAVTLGLDADLAMERAVERLSLTGSTEAATPEGIRDATTEAETNALLVQTALEQLDADPELGLETAAGLDAEGAALLKLAAAHEQPLLLPALQEVAGVDALVDEQGGTKLHSDGSLRIGRNEHGLFGSVNAANGKASVGIAGRKGPDGTLSATYDGEKLGIGREYESDSGRYGSAAMEFDGLELTKVSLGGGKSWKGPGNTKVKAGVGLELHTENTLDELDENGTGKAVDGGSIQFGGGVGGSIFGVSGQVGYGDVTTTEAKNLRGGGSEYTEAREAGWSWGAGASSAAGGLFFTGSDVDIDGRTVRFDATEQGREARRHYDRTRELPPGGGYTVVSTETGEAKRDGYAFSLFGAGIGNQDELRQTTTTDAEGNATDRVRSTDQTTARLPFVGSVVSHTNALEEMSLAGSDTSVWTATTHVEDRWADDAHAGLAAGTQGNTMRDIEGRASGKWTVQSVLSDEGMDGFLERAEEGNDLGTYELRQALKGASSEAERKEVLHAWVQEEGDDAVQAIRALAPTLDYVALEGDTYLTGLQGQMEYEDRMLDFRARLKDPNADKVDLIEDVRSVLAYQQKRRSHLEDRGNYAELPGGLRRAEIDRSKRAIKALESVRSSALLIMEHDPDYADDVAFVKEDAANAAHVSKHKEAAYEARDDARAALWRHQGMGLPTTDDGRRHFVDGLRAVHGPIYEKAEAEYDRGEGFLECGVKSEADLAAAIPDSGEAVDAELKVANAAATWYHRSTQAYEKYLDQMDTIDAAHGDRAALNVQAGLDDFFAPSSLG